MPIFRELKRRNVFRVAAAYIVSAWLVIQVAETIFPLFGFGDTPARMVVILLAIGFPLFLVFSWVFEFTPEGLKLEKDVKRDESTVPEAGKKLDRFIIVSLALALGYFAFDKFVLDPGRDIRIAESARQEGRSEALAGSYGDKSIAVLPFVNMSSDPDQDYFSDGISEELLNLLARIPGLRVISRSSSFSFRDKDIEIPAIAARLNVAHIVEGSVRKAGNRVRITAQLIEARSDTRLWSETYDRELLDTFAVQDEIAAEIVGRLQLTLTGAVRAGRPTESEEAYDKYLRGWHFMRQGWDREHFLAARKYFSEAAGIDPGFARAHAMLSLTEASLGNFRHLAPNDVFPSAYESASNALALDETSPEAHAAMGWLALSYQFDWKKAEEEFRRTIELAPGNSIGYNGLSYALQAGGRLDEALAAARQVFELDPMMLWSRIVQAEVQFKRRDYDAALEQVQAILEMQPGDALTLAWAGNIYAAKGMYDPAREYVLQAARLVGEDPNLGLQLAGLHALLGDEAEARRLLETAMAHRESVFVSPASIAIVYTHLGEHDRAIDWLYRGVEAHDSYLFNLGYPDFDALRSRPRFKELCDQLRMPCAERLESR